MRRYYSSTIVPFGPVDSGAIALATPTNDSKSAAPSSSAGASTSSSGASTTASSPGGTSASDQGRVQKYLDAALKNTGFKAEITNVHNGFTVLKLVQADTGQVILQMPNQAILSIVASLDQQEARDGSDVQAPATGAVLDQLA